MDDKTRVSFLFDGHQFEKFKAENKDIGEISLSYTIDGCQVEEAEWAQQCQRAVARDLSKLFPKLIKRGEV